MPLPSDTRHRQKNVGGRGVVAEVNFDSTWLLCLAQLPLAGEQHLLHVAGTSGTTIFVRTELQSSFPIALFDDALTLRQRRNCLGAVTEFQAIRHNALR